jgi:hypothetical protein
MTIKNKHLFLDDIKNQSLKNKKNAAYAAFFETICGPAKNRTWI